MSVKSTEQTTVYRITPMDRKGEQDGNSYMTEDKMVAIHAFAEGHRIESCDFFTVVTLDFVPD